MTINSETTQNDNYVHGSWDDLLTDLDLSEDTGNVLPEKPEQDE